ASIPAGDPVLCERTLQALLKHGAHPRYVVIEVCPEGVTEPTAWLAAYVGWTLCWDDAPAYLKDLTVTGNLLRFAGTRVIPLYVYRDQIRRQIGTQVNAWWGRRALAPAFAAPPPTAVQPAVHAIE